MHIQNSKGSIIEVTEEKWKELRGLGWAASWKVVSEEVAEKLVIKKIDEIIEIKRPTRRTKKVELKKGDKK